MNISLECKKVKRTGFFPVFILGGLSAAAIPVMNMAFRGEMYLNLSGTPVQILLDANWQMMAMLNMLLILSGTCLLYHTEYADNAMQKMHALPVHESSVFLSKAVLAVLMSLLMLIIEAGALAFCSFRWFGAEKNFFSQLGKHFGYVFLLMLPCVILSLLISQACKNMWVTLGIGVVCAFTATMLPASNFVLSLFPFALPFRVLSPEDTPQSAYYLYGAAGEIMVLLLAEPVLIKIRRFFV